MSGTVFGNRSRQRPGSPYTDSSLDLASLGSKSILDDDGSVAMDAALPRQPPRRVNIFILFIFILELLCLVFVAVLAYFLRMTDVFPVRHQNFSCWDAAISLTPAAGADSFSSFSFRADVPDTAVITVCFCLPPLLIVLCEAALWAVTDEPQKTVRALCHEFKLPQAVRRVIRFTGTFLFGLLVTLVLTDVTKLFVGRLRPTFLASCRPNATRCGQHGDIVDEDACTETDMAVIRHARLSFPSLHASTTFYTAVFLAIYLHAVIRVPGVRVLRPFLGLGCVTMATMCCLARYGRHHSHWTDVAAGAGGGATIALYISLSVLTSFRERLSAAALYARLRLFLQQQRHLELSHLYKEDRLERGSSSSHFAFPGSPARRRREYVGAMAIPRPHVIGGESNGGFAAGGESSTDADLLHRGAGSLDQNTFQRDLARTLDQYRRDVNNPPPPHYRHM